MEMGFFQPVLVERTSVIAWFASGNTILLRAVTFRSNIDAPDRKEQCSNTGRVIK